MLMFVAADVYEFEFKKLILCNIVDILSYNSCYRIECNW